MPDSLDRLVTVATDAVKEVWSSEIYADAAEAQRAIALELRGLRDQEEPPEVLLATEKTLLRWEREEFADNAAMRTSLDNAVSDLEAAAKMLPRVRDAARYAQEVDATHTIPKRRVRGLPRDDAREFFASHATRLGNLAKARAPAVEKFVLSERRRNVRAAAQAYTDLQRVAVLGRHPTGGGCERDDL